MLCRKIKFVILLVQFVALSVAVCAENLPYGQEHLEEWLYHIEPDDFFPNGEPPYVPHRYRDALPEFRVFFERSGWTTNQFVEGLVFAVSNNLDAVKAGNEGKCRVAGRAIWKMSEINHPAVTNFFRIFNDTDDTTLFKPDTIPAIFRYTNLEPDVMAYMRSLCVRTNIYNKVETIVMRDMLETLSTMPDELKPAATNRVAKYMYFAIRNTTRRMGWQDRELANFIPAYSNSIQRLDAMRYVQSTTTNLRTRAIAQQQVDRLSAIPTNQLNDISWIAEDLNGGN